MQIETVHYQGSVPVTVFTLVGDLTAEEPLLGRVREEFSAGTRNILLDLLKVPYISSAGLRSLHSIYLILRDADPTDAAKAKSGIIQGTYKSPHLKLLSPSKNGTKALDVAGYDMFLEIFNDYNKAVASFQ